MVSGVPAATAWPLTTDTVLVSPASTSLSLPVTLPVTLGVPANGVLPGFTPASTTAAVSACAIGASLTAATLAMVTVAGAEGAPKLSVTKKVTGATAPL